jgi:hypothetical protein
MLLLDWKARDAAAPSAAHAPLLPDRWKQVQLLLLLLLLLRW